MKDMMHISVCAAVLSVAMVGCGSVSTENPDAGSKNGPAIAEISPERVPKFGGTTVTVTGTGFLSEEGTVNVVVGGVKAADATVVDDSTVTFTTPEGPDFDVTVDVIVFTPKGFAEIKDGLTYNPRPILTSIEPDFGPQSGGTTLTLQGRGFADFSPGANTIMIGSAEVSEFTVVDDSTIEVTTPQLADEPFQALDVTIDNDNGDATLPGVFRYTAQGLLAVTSPRTGFQGNYLWHVDPETGVSTPIVKLQQRLTAITLGPDDVLYGMQRSPATLYKVDPVTGGVDIIGPMETVDGVVHTYNRLAFAGSNLYTYNRNTQLLAQVNPTTGIVADKGATQHLSSDTTGLAAASATTLYWLNRMNAALYTVNPATGAFTQAVALTGTALQVHGAVIADGKLFVVSLNRSGGAAKLWELNPATGIFSEVGDVQNFLHSLSITPSTF